MNVKLREFIVYSRWNDRIPDPDNPNQPRQIDITVIWDNELTIIECRIHNRKQDVNWIEELMGRRVSLKADAVIAVSASGFTDGAIRAELHPGNITVAGIQVKAIIFQGRFRPIRRELNIPSAVACDCPEIDALERNAFIQAVEAGNFEIRQSSNTVSVTIDLSPITPPVNSLFYSVNVHHKRPLVLKSFEIIGWPDMGIKLKDVKMTAGLAKG